jgi:hypothetical protein
MLPTVLTFNVVLVLFSKEKAANDTAAFNFVFYPNTPVSFCDMIRMVFSVSFSAGPIDSQAFFASYSVRLSFVFTDYAFHVFLERSPPAVSPPFLAFRFLEGPLVTNGGASFSCQGLLDNSFL